MGPGTRTPEPSSAARTSPLAVPPSTWLPALLLGVLVASALSLAACATRAGRAEPEEDADAPMSEPWLRRRVLPTVLVRHAPPPGAAAPLALGPGMELVHFPSPTREGERALLAVLAAPRSAPETASALSDKRPAVLLLHSGFALQDEHLAWAAPFVEAGFVVMLPSLRGENGNPGELERLVGELDDVKAAGRWLASQPDVDLDHLYLFGHGEGGALAALLALDPDLPFRRIAASSGVTTAASFERDRRAQPWSVPFDLGDEGELKRRALLPNAAELAQPLALYVGEDDALGLRDARRVAERAPERVELVTVAGDASSAVTAALQRFLALVVADAGQAPLAATWPRAASSRSAP